MNILMLQHAKVEHPGRFRQFLTEDGHSWDTVHLYAGQPLPDLNGHDALWVLGGPMDVWQEDEHPWLVPEKALIREAVEARGMPFLGLCLGHQLLAEALGGACGPARTPEIGVMDVTMTEDGAQSVLLDGLPTTFPALQWHAAEVTSMPPGAQCLATSHACAVQAMKWGPRAASVQFHLEVEAGTVADWATIPEYDTALRGALGETGAADLAGAVASQIDTFADMAERVYINWMQTTARV